IMRSGTLREKAPVNSTFSTLPPIIVASLPAVAAVANWTWLYVLGVPSKLMPVTDFSNKGLWGPVFMDSGEVDAPAGSVGIGLAPVSTGVLGLTDVEVGVKPARTDSGATEGMAAGVNVSANHFWKSAAAVFCS